MSNGANELKVSHPAYSLAALSTMLALWATVAGLVGGPEWLYSTTIVSVAGTWIALSWSAAIAWDRRARLRPHAQLYLMALALGAAALAVAWQLPVLEVGGALRLTDAERLEARNAVRMTALTAFAGLALFVNWIQGDKKHKLELRQDRSKRAEQAAADLNGDSEIKRTAALFTLVGLLDGPEEERTLVFALLGAFIVKSLNEMDGPRGDPSLRPLPSASTQSALALVAARSLAEESGEVLLEGLIVDDACIPSLVGVAVPGAELYRCELRRIAASAFRNVTSQDVTIGAVEKTVFEGGTMTRSRLRGTSLRNVNFVQVRFVDVRFDEVVEWNQVAFYECVFEGGQPPRPGDAEMHGCSFHAARL